MNAEEARKIFQDQDRQEEARQRATLHHLRVRVRYRGKPGYSAKHFQQVSPAADTTLCGAPSERDDVQVSALAFYRAKGWTFCPACLARLDGLSRPLACW